MFGTEVNSMISVFTKIIDLIFLNTRYYIPILLFMLAVMGTYKCYKVYKLPKYILYSMICICVDVFVTYVLYNVIKSRIILFVMAIILVGIILYAIWHYISISHTLRRVINFSDEERFDANFVEAWNLTYDLKTSVMTKKQLDKYNRYRIFLRAKLGCFHANEQELQIYENGDRCQKAFYHFIRFIQYLAMGEVQKAYDNIKEAEALSNGDIDKVLRSQILINRGVAYVQLGMYQDADDAFIRAISYCQKHNIKSSYLWNVLYSDYIFNKTRLNPDISMEEMDEILEQYKEYIDCKNIVEYINLFNTRLELLRQMKADRKKLNDVVHSVFDYVQNSNIPKLNRCVFEATTARIIWASALNPTYILEALSRDVDLLSKLPMPVRYDSYKNIELLFKDLHGNIVERYTSLKDRAVEYMQNEAERDLEGYRRSLPAEAVYQRYFCFYELAGIQKRNKQNYKWSVVEEYLKNASALYHENGLLIDEIMTKLALVDEASDVINCDEHLQFTRKDEMFRTLDEVEAMLPKLEQHPVINEIALRISFYSVALNDYLRCKNYYELYRKSSDQVSIDHYAPWVHKYHMDVIFYVRILYIVDSINKIIDHIDDFDLSPLAREWFAGFGKIGGDVIHLVIGLLIGFDNAVSLKECLLLDEANRIVDNYEWMNFPEFGLEIDVQNTDVIFFHPGQHPLENEKVKKCIFETVIELDKFSVEQQSALREVCKIITENMVSEAPTIDELKAAFNSVMLPKTII